MDYNGMFLRFISSFLPFQFDILLVTSDLLYYRYVTILSTTVILLLRLLIKVFEVPGVA